MFNQMLPPPKFDPDALGRAVTAVNDGVEDVYPATSSRMAGAMGGEPKTLEREMSV
jgi:hypothetical protein